MLAAQALGGCGACSGAARCGDARAPRGLWCLSPPRAHAPTQQQHAPHAPCSRLAAAPPQQPPQQHAARRRRGAPLAALPEAAALAAAATAAASAAASATPAGAYEPPPVEAWQLWVGFLGGVSPFIIAGARARVLQRPLLPTKTRATRAQKRPPRNWKNAHASTLLALTPPRACALALCSAYEFGKRILIQRRCALCGGSGLIQRPAGATAGAAAATTTAAPLRKCTACGGFLPWVSWRLFLQSAPGNGGVVRPPSAQTSVIYDVDAAVAASKDAADVARIVARAQAEQQQDDSARGGGGGGSA
jgi:hypothetical protein